MKSLNFLFLILLSSQLSAQWLFKTNFDLGLVCSGFSKKIEKDFPKLEKINLQEFCPIISPTFGLNIRMIHKHWYTELGSQYSKIGSTENSFTIRYGKDKSLFDNYTKHIQEFTRISMPINIGYAIDLNRKLKLCLTAGSKFNYFIKAKDAILFKINIDPTSFSEEEIITNPFSTLDYSIIPKRYNFSTIFGIGLKYEKIGFNFNFSFNNAMSYGNIAGFEGYFQYWKMNDLSFNIKYYFDSI